MRATLRSLALAVAAAAAMACTPPSHAASDFFLSGSMQARVVDARTHDPIANASILVHSSEDADAVVAGKTGADGVVTLPPLKGHMAMSIWEHGPAPAVATISAPGYAARDVDSKAHPEYFRAVNQTKPIEPLELNRAN